MSTHPVLRNAVLMFKFRTLGAEPASVPDLLLEKVKVQSLSKEMYAERKRQNVKKKETEI